MKPGDTIMLHSLGTAGTASRQIDIEITLGRKPKNRARRIASQLGRLVASLPKLVAKGQLKLQNRTNIIGYLVTLAPSLDCRNQPTTLRIFSDSIEWSTFISGDDLLSGKKDLPAPSGEILKGCHVSMHGVGQQSEKLGTDARWFVRLRDQWTKFFDAAGVASFKAYGEVR